MRPRPGRHRLRAGGQEVVAGTGPRSAIPFCAASVSTCSMVGGPPPENLAVLMRDVFMLLNDRVLLRLAERGHGVVRPVHSAVFEHLDDTGTTVTVLAERANMTRQAMAELVAHLEAHDYVTREPDPADRRAKLVRPTARGREAVRIAQELVPQLEAWVAELIGADRAANLRADLQTLRTALHHSPQRH
ncbi:MarR family winged helix-turn-helix transcriptional regulator [Dactylosporangium matsuzakiense]|nr:MarR family winged helix-turn-helix transcriptional regulator [Dactylosporangium matsuzakiense]